MSYETPPRKSASERTPEERGLIAIFYNLLEDPLDLDLRDKFIDRLAEYELKARIRAEYDKQDDGRPVYCRTT